MLIRKCLMLVGVLLLLTGCSWWGVAIIPEDKILESRVDALEDSFADIKTLDQWVEIISAPCEPVRSSDALYDACLRLNRNAVAEDLLSVIDFHYYEYEGGILAGKAKWDFASEVATFTLSSLSAVLTPVTTKTALSSTAALLGAAQTSNLKNFYGDASMFALTARMRADREIALKQIRKGLTTSYSEYPFGQFQQNLIRYYRAGTLSTAIQNIGIEASKDEDTAQQENKVLEGQQEKLRQELDSAVKRFVQ